MWNLTWFLVPVGVRWYQHTPPPKAHGPVETKYSVAVGFLVKFPIHKLVIQSAQFGNVSLPAHRGTGVLVPVLRPDRHWQVNSGQYAKDTADDQRRGVTVVNHCLPTDGTVKRD